MNANEDREIQQGHKITSISLMQDHERKKRKLGPIPESIVSIENKHKIDFYMETSATIESNMDIVEAFVTNASSPLEYCIITILFTTPSPST